MKPFNSYFEAMCYVDMYAKGQCSVRVRFLLFGSIDEHEALVFVWDEFEFCRPV